MADSPETTIQPGARLSGFTHAISRTDIVRFAGAGGDFNPLHHDDELARSAGFPSVFAMGLLPGGMLVRLLLDHFPDGFVRRYRIRFNAPVFPGKPLEFTGVVKDVVSEAGGCMLTVDLSVTGDEDHAFIIGEADVWLPDASAGNTRTDGD